MENQNGPTNWAERDFTIPLLLSGVVSTVLCIAFCVVLYFSQDFINNDLAPRLGLVDPTPAPIPCPDVPTGWKELMKNDFNTNKYGWVVGKNSDEYADDDLEVVDGLLRYDIKANKGVYSPFLPDMRSVPLDFYLTTQARQVSGPEDAEYGVVFRVNDSQVLYFTVRDSGRVRVDLKDSLDNWHDPLFDGYVENIHMGQNNHLVVIAQDDLYTLCINQFVVGEFHTGLYPYGKVGLAVELHNADDHAVFEFDDFEVYMPTP